MVLAKRMTSRALLERCGTKVYAKGERLYQTDGVQELTYNAKTLVYEAKVTGVKLSKSYAVRISMDPYGELEASCECATFHKYYTDCEHIAAVFMEIMDIERKQGQMAGSAAEAAPSVGDQAQARTQQQNMLTERVRAEQYEQAEQFLALYDNTMPRAPRQTHHYVVQDHEELPVQCICRIVTDYLRPNVLTLELRVGARGFIVHQLKRFLAHVDRGDSLELTKTLTYDPEKHRFSPQVRAVLEQLIVFCRNEAVYSESWGGTSGYTSYHQEREMIIPPSAWEQLLPKLIAAQTELYIQQQSMGPLAISDKGVKLPLIFQFEDLRNDGYALEVYGITDMIVLEAYHSVLLDGALYQLSQGEAERIAAMKKLLQNKPQLLLTAEQMEPFMERVLPSLHQLGQVRITERIEARMRMHSLRAKIYLDRNLQDQLLVRLEFVYGDIVLPVTPAGAPSSHATDIILIRDSEKEALVFALMQAISSRPYHDRFLFEHEEDVYHFLYHVLPELEQHAEIYATAAIQEVMELPHTAYGSPKSTVNVKGDSSWLEIGFRMDGLDLNEIQQLIHAIMEKKKYYRLKTGAFVSLEQEEFQQFGMLLNQLGVRRDDVRGPQIAAPVLHALRIEDQEDALHHVKFGKELRQLITHLKHPEQLEFEAPTKLVATLRDYQQVGYQWLKTLAHYRFGGILADDMGLGKTLQSISYILAEHEQAAAQAPLSSSSQPSQPSLSPPSQPSLIVCPASLSYNWAAEFRKFAPSLRVAIVIGDRKEREELLTHRAADVFITSYPLLRRDIELYQQTEFGVVFFDEAQAFKNHGSQTSQTVRMLRARQRFALTGTPIENSLAELWAIFDAIFPELFQSKQLFQELHPQQVARMVKPFILRRMKRDVLTELPDKIETLQTTELYPEQKKLYAAFLEKLRKEASKELVEEGFPKSRMKILAGLTRLRQLCCHPALFVEDYQGSSSKLEQLFEIIEECLDCGKRMLIFSQFTGMLDIIREMLSRMGLPCFYLAGDTPVQARQEMCQRFNDGEHQIFLISLKAGGTGLNLTGADTVILYDLWWNPAVEQQAADRAYRMGQKNVVQVIRLITQGTVEEKMYALQQKKRDLIDEVIHTGEGAVAAFTEEDIREILSL